MRRAWRSAAGLAGGGAAALAAHATAFAQVGALTGGHPAGDIGSYGLMDWLGIGLRLAVVLGVIWGAFVLMRWYLHRMNGEHAGPGARQLQVVETRALGPNRALHLVRVGGRAVLIGVTPDRINQLMQIDDPEEVERLAQLPPVSEGRSLRSMMGALPGSLMRAAVPGSALRSAAAEPAAPRRGIRASLRTLLARLSGVPVRTTPPASTATSPRLPTRAGAPAPTPFAAPRAEAAPLLDATPPSALALRARSGYRDSQISEIQRAIAQARSGVDLDRAMGRRAQ